MARAHGVVEAVADAGCIVQSHTETCKVTTEISFARPKVNGFGVFSSSKVMVVSEHFVQITPVLFAFSKVALVSVSIVQTIWSTITPFLSFTIVQTSACVSSHFSLFPFKSSNVTLFVQSYAQTLCAYRVFRRSRSGVSDASYHHIVSQ